MKKKILNWIYGICRKILATEKKDLEWISEKRVYPIHHLQEEVMVPDWEIQQARAIDVPMMRKDQITIRLLQQIEPYIFLEEVSSYGRFTIYRASIKVISTNDGTNE